MNINYKLFTPGPIDVPEDVLQEIAKPLVYHREDMFGGLIEDVTKKLKKITFSDGCEFFFFTSSGTGAMEATCCNILSSKDMPIVAVSGKFGERWLEICATYKIEPVILQEDYGKSINPERLEDALKKLKRSTVILTTLTETSTGAINDIKSFGEIAKKYDSYLVVDGVAGIGADYCPQNDWNVDVLVGASQKALMAPPGISFITMSARTMERIEKSDLPKYYFNLKIYEKFKSKHQTPFTPAISIFYGLRKGLDKILSIGVEENFNHHKEMAAFVRRRVVKMGLELLPESPSNALTVIKMPEHIDSTSVIKEIKEKHKILFANGQGILKGKIIRIGHMGNYDINKLSKALDIAEAVLKSWSK